MKDGTRMALIGGAALLALAGAGAGGAAIAAKVDVAGSGGGATVAATPQMSTTDSFKLDIQRDGLVPAGNDTAASAAVGVAQAACDVRRAGMTRNAEIRQLAANSNSWDQAQAGEFLSYSERYYCPEFSGKP